MRNLPGFRVGARSMGSISRRATFIACRVKMRLKRRVMGLAVATMGEASIPLRYLRPELAGKRQA